MHISRAPLPSAGGKPKTLEGEGEDEEQFHEDPLKVYCPACEMHVITKVKGKTNWQTWVILLLLVLVTGLIGLCVFPFVRNFTRDVSHRCPNCKSELARYSRFKLPHLKPEVITMQCGNCAMVFSKRYFISFLALATLILTLSVTKTYIKTFRLPNLAAGPPLTRTWDDFRADCGELSYLRNPPRALKRFDELYYGKSTVDWQGTVRKVRLGLLGKNFIFVSMSGGNDKDLALIYSADQFDDQVAELDLGDLLEFNATLLELGLRGDPTIADLHGMRRLERVADVSSTVTGGKYDWLRKAPIAHVPELAQRLQDLHKRGGSVSHVYIGDEAIPV